MNFDIGGQHYERIGVIGHTRRDGSASQLVVLRAKCARCQEPFEQTTTEMKIEQRHVNRRCQRCKRPGSWVRR